MTGPRWQAVTFNFDYSGGEVFVNEMTVLSLVCYPAKTFRVTPYNNL